MATNDILKIIPAIQSVKLVQHNYKKLKKKKLEHKDVLGLGLTNITATALIDAEGEFL